LAIINDILDFSKIEAGKLALDPAPFDLAHTIDGIMELLAPRVAERGLGIAARRSPGSPRQVVGDEGRVR
jgi:signal transduction histidine kinase